MPRVDENLLDERAPRDIRPLRRRRPRPYDGYMTAPTSTQARNERERRGAQANVSNSLKMSHFVSFLSQNPLISVSNRRAPKRPKIRPTWEKDATDDRK